MSSGLPSVGPDGMSTISRRELQHANRTFPDISGPSLGDDTCASTKKAPVSGGFDGGR
jgi:hypothetical protein